MVLRAEGGPTGGEEAGASRYKSSGGGGTTTSGGKGNVFMGRAGGLGMGADYAPGYVSPYAPTGATGATLGEGNVPEHRLSSEMYLGKQDAYTVFNSFSGKQLRDFISKGQYAGQLQDDAGFLEAQNLWKRLVDASAGLTSSGRKISPMDVLDAYLGKGPSARGAGVSAEPVVSPSGRRSSGVVASSWSTPRRVR